MRRIIHNTTAIAACLSLLLPQLATAEMVRPANDAGQFPEAVVLAQADAQQDPQLTEEQLRKKLQRKQRQAEKEAARQAAEAEQARKDAKKPAKGADQNEAQDRPAKKKSDQQAEAKKRPQKKEDQPDRQKADQKKADQNKNKAAQNSQQDEQRPAKKDAQAQKNAKDVRERKDQQRQDQQRQDQQDAQRRQQPDRAPAKRPATDTVAVRRASSDTATGRADHMTGLSRVLDEEIASGLTEDRLACVSGGLYPCKNGERLVTPRGIVVERNNHGNYQLAPGSTQMYRVNDNGRLVARAAEEDQRQTRAAREAARETRAAQAAALDEARKRRSIREQRITEANRRASSEDFATSLQDALTRREDRRRADDSDDDNSDLFKALLLGAGALAVGSMLNNNRQVALSSPDRVVLTRDDGSQEVIKDETALLRQPGSTVTTENFDDGSSRTIVTRPDGSKVVTIRDADLRVLRRTLISPDGRTTRLIDDTEAVAPVDIANLPAPAPVFDDGTSTDEAALRAALRREADFDRRFTLGQIRNIPEVRSLVAPVNIDAITFDTGSAAIRPDQARQLSGLGEVIDEAIAGNPREMFLIEGYTDTVGPDPMNLALSDRRAESVALALSEYFDVPPENLIVQGYGEQFLKVRSEGDIRANRRVSVRRITDLLQTADAQ